MTRLADIELDAPPVVVIPVFLALLAGLALLSARLLALWLARAGREHHFDERATPRLELPVAVAMMLGGVLLVAPELGLRPPVGGWLAKGLGVAFVLACAVVVARVGLAAVTTYAGRHEGVRPALGVARAAVRLLVGIAAILMALQGLGVKVTPVLTALGFGSLGIALALQDTLSNFFAGLYLLADRPVRVGDFIKGPDIDGGVVETIGWRSSRLRTLQNNVVIVPNQKLAQAVLTNFHLPEPHMAVNVPVTVPYEADVDAVEGYLMDELTLAAAEVPELAPDEHPTVRLAQFSDAGLVFHCTIHARDYPSQFAAAHHVRKRIFARLRHEGVEIPYPHQVVTAAEPPERRRHPR